MGLGHNSSVFRSKFPVLRPWGFAFILEALLLASCQPYETSPLPTDATAGRPSQELMQSPVEPKTEAELNSLVEQYRHASFAASIDEHNRFSCLSKPKLDSALLSVKSCMQGSQCAEKGIRDPERLAQCITDKKPELLREYLEQWHKVFGK
ncbi:MAG: hypothetical protein ACTHKR_11740 [Sphingomonas sp.]